MFYMIGNLRVRDKRVNKMLTSRHLPDTDIYYSPLSSWILCLVLLLAGGLWIFFSQFFLQHYPWFLLYPVIGYLIAAYLNTSFALTNDALIAVNPNFPFRKLKVYPLKDIQLVIFDETRFKGHYLFAIWGRNYITIQTAQKKQRYYCVNLELDAFDENWTEKTIDSLHESLKDKGVPTSFKLDG